MERVKYTRNDRAAGLLAEHYKRTPVALVRSFGCQQSVNDGERMKGVLTDLGFALTDQPADADLILYNTCAVREHAEQRVFGNLGALKALKASNPGLLIGLCGCMAEEQTTVDRLRKSYPHVDMVLGVNAADQLPDILVEKIGGAKRILQVPEIRSQIVEQVPTYREHGFKAFLPIMYGCNNFCTYCIVPYVRGRERSRASADILAEFCGLVENGYKEITLLGQNVNSYGKGVEGELDFSDLLRLLCETPGEYKVRFMTSHPRDASRKLIDTIADNEHICKHLHLPVQSGSDRMLLAMNRHYTVAEYMELIEYAKRRCPEMTFSSDVIVGFPGETEQDYAATLELVERVGYTQLFTFIYSKRTGTKAADMPDETPRETKVARLEGLLRLQEKCMARVSAPWIGAEYTALVEGPGREDGRMAARLDNNMLAEFASEAAQPGQMVCLQIDEAKNALLLAHEV